jgi:hypothetical protein
MDPSGTCCTMPGACLLIGALFGLSLTVFLPGSSSRGFARRLEGAAGMVLGTTSVAAMRCAGLFAGETLGLVGGLFAGVAAAALARAWLDARRSTAS